jgi:hypothetical protein
MDLVYLELYHRRRVELRPEPVERLLPLWSVVGDPIAFFSCWFLTRLTEGMG